jgi:hypothetical protein
LREAMVAQMAPGEGPGVFASLPDEDKVRLNQRISSAGDLDLDRQLREGRFWEHADGEMIRRYFNRHPERFFDGAFWNELYANPALPPGGSRGAVQDELVARFDRFLADAIWLASRDARSLEQIDYDEIDRALKALRLLRPDR